MVKIDVMPLKAFPFPLEEARRAQMTILDTSMPPVRIVSPEDAVLAKLDWYRISPSHRQWADVLGVIQTQQQRGTALNLAYLRHWADHLRVRDLLERALLDSQTQAP